MLRPNAKPLGSPRRAARPAGAALIILVAAGLGLSAVGCALSGSWRTVSVEPAGAPVPLDRIDFEQGGRYTATWNDNGDARTGVGMYRWNGSTLTISQTGREPRRYRLRRRLDGNLALTYEGDSAKIVAILKREEE